MKTTKIFVDTAPFIYLIENHEDYADKISQYLLEAVLQQKELHTSVVSLAEFGVKPEELGKQEVIFAFENLLQQLNFTVHSIDQQTARTAYKLRSRYKSLKGMDSLQLASALVHSCQIFLTNDKKIPSIEDIDIQLIDDLK